MTFIRRYLSITFYYRAGLWRTMYGCRSFSQAVEHSNGQFWMCRKVAFGQQSLFYICSGLHAVSWNGDVYRRHHQTFRLASSNHSRRIRANMAGISWAHWCNGESLTNYFMSILIYFHTHPLLNIHVHYLITKNL